MVRKMIKSDVPFYNFVRNECCEFLHDPTKYTLQEAYEWFDKKKNPFYMYELNGETIGYFRTSEWSFGGDSVSCYVGMDIHKDYRGKGLATKAYEEFFEYLTKHHSVSTFNLEVLDTNTRARNLYKKLGFKEVKTIFYNKEQSSILMQLHKGK